MGHQIAEAIIEDEKLVYINKKLPSGRLRVHLIYDTEDSSVEGDIERIIRETTGLYPTIDPETESSELRKEWDRYE